MKGKFAWGHINSDDRLTKPLLRDGDTYREIEWKEALDIIEHTFKRIKAEHGPDALAFIASSKCTNEESFLMQKLSRAVIGTNNVDNCARYCQNPATRVCSAQSAMAATRAPSLISRRPASSSSSVANPAENHPVLCTRVKRSHKHRGQRLIVADLRKHEMAERADIFFRPNPSTDAVWICAVAKYILDNGLAKMDFINQWVNHFDEYKKSLEPYTLEYAEKVTGVPAARSITVANEIAAADGVCILFAMGVTQHCGGSDTATSLSNLLLLTGNYMRPGAGAYPLRGHNNVQGASDFGSMPNVFSGYQKVDDPDIRAKFEADWGVTLPTSTGKDNHEMIEAILEGSIKWLYIKGEDTITSDSNANYVGRRARESRVPDRAGHQLLRDRDASPTWYCRPAPRLKKKAPSPALNAASSDIYKAMEPLGEAKADWEIIQLIANRMGGNWNYTHPSEVMDEVARLTPLFAGVNYDRLEGFNSLQWPVHADGTDSPLLFTEKFPFPMARQGSTRSNTFLRSEETSSVYDLHLNNGRLLEHFEQGSMTYRTAGIKEITPNNWVEISPELAAERGITTGRYVQVTSPHGKVRVQVLVSDRVQGKQLYMPLNSVEEPVNRLTSSFTDRATHTPAFKETAVNMTVLPEQGENPLPRRNFRYGTRTPQPGLEIERKWARPDYHLPGTSPGDKLVQIASTTV